MHILNEIMKSWNHGCFANDISLIIDAIHWAASIQNGSNNSFGAYRIIFSKILFIFLIISIRSMITIHAIVAINWVSSFRRKKKEKKERRTQRKEIKLVMMQSRWNHMPSTSQQFIYTNVYFFFAAHDKNKYYRFNLERKRVFKRYMLRSHNPIYYLLMVVANNDAK